MKNINLEELPQAKLVLSKFKENKSKRDIFYNLCFCICIPQSKFTSNLKSIRNLKDYNFYQNSIDTEKLKELIKESRFKNRKAVYLQEAKEKFQEFLKNLNEIENAREKRDWLVHNIKGIGLKTASHLLRNLGHEDLAIVDVHILRFFNLDKEKWNYPEVEEKMKKLSRKYKLSIAELDSLIWKNYSKIDWKDFNY